ncbi:MAG: TauD/TfdA family dioxygenase [Kofleriaceae bacterium]
MNVQIVEGHGAPLSSISRADKLALLREHGGVVFTGFEVDSAAFRHTADELGRSFYNMSLDPRVRQLVTADGVVAGVLKGSAALPLHMERGYSPLRPELVMFHVVTPSTVGGESLMCHGARVLAALSPATRDRLRASRLLYRHTWEPEAWQGRYGTTPDEVARLFERTPGIVGFRFDGELLHYDYVISAIVRSRLGGDEGFVNNLEGMWDVQNAPRALLRAVHAHSVQFEDGEPISQDLIDEVHAAVVSSTETHQTRACDVIVLDNYRVMHGRRAFEGERVMHTIMADANA